MLPAPGTSYTPINQVWACFAEGEEPPEHRMPGRAPPAPRPACSKLLGGCPRCEGLPQGPGCVLGGHHEIL